MVQCCAVVDFYTAETQSSRVTEKIISFARYEIDVKFLKRKTHSKCFVYALGLKQYRYSSGFRNAWTLISIYAADPDELVLSKGKYLLSLSGICAGNEPIFGVPIKELYLTSSATR